MTVTYDGSKITTDTLYEDGTIQVKKGINKIPRDVFSIKDWSIDKIRVRSITRLLNMNDTASLTNLNLTKLKICTKIINVSQQENLGILKEPSLNKITIKSSIITP